MPSNIGGKMLASKLLFWQATALEDLFQLFTLKNIPKESTGWFFFPQPEQQGLLINKSKKEQARPGFSSALLKPSGDGKSGLQKLLMSVALEIRSSTFFLKIDWKFRRKKEIAGRITWNMLEISSSVAKQGFICYLTILFSQPEASRW